MINHYLKLAIRDLFKHKYYAFINVFGLVFGMLSVLIIAKYLGGSLSVDQFHEKKGNIYSITQTESIGGDQQKDRNSTYWGVGELLNQFPEVVNTTRYGYYVESLITAEDDDGKRSFLENRIFSVDSGFLKIFSFPLIHGDQRTALSRRNSVVLTRSASQRYFGNLNPVGKTLTARFSWGAKATYEVTGVVEDVPRRSGFQFDFIVSHPAAGPEESWYVPDYPTYLLLKDDADANELSAKITSMLSHVPQLTSANKKLSVTLRSLADVQLSNTEYVLLAVGIFILIISWVNYINQVIAQSYWRMKEIGILRVMGAARSNLIVQFITESALICVTSLIMIVVIYIGLEPTLQVLTNSHLLPLINDSTPINFIFVLTFIIGIVSAAAIATAIFFSQDFGGSLRNLYSTRIGGVGLRRILVVLQFSISTVLMISVFVISNQLEYMNSKDKGITLDDVLIIQAPVVRDTSWVVKRKTVELFKEQCAALSFVTDVASSTTVPSEEYRQETFISLVGDNTKSMVHQNGVDEKFFDLYEVKFVAGNNFIKDALAKNRTSIILNESAAFALGIVDFDKITNLKITDHESNEVYDLIGIVKDYHQTSLKFEMRPIAFKFNVTRGHFSLKINPVKLSDDQLEENLGAIKQIWAQVYEDSPFDKFFLAERFAEQDREDLYFGKLFNYFTVLSIIISCLGLFGLSLLISTKRQREIGVRKVFGASSLSILTIILRSYLGSLCFAMVVGTPLAYYLMKIWLSNYAYRIEIGMSIIIIALLTLTTVFLLTVAYHTIKSAISNPVKILRS